MSSNIWATSRSIQYTPSCSDQRTGSCRPIARAVPAWPRQDVGDAVPAVGGVGGRGQLLAAEPGIGLANPVAEQRLSAARQFLPDFPANALSAVQNLDCPLSSARAVPPVRTKGPGLGTTRGRLAVMDESDLYVLRKRAEGGDKDAVDQLIELAGEQGNLEELRRLADQGNTTASDQLIELAGEQGNLEELRRLADQGNTTASEMLAELEE
jgi:hypothetical protein